MASKTVLGAVLIVIVASVTTPFVAFAQAQPTAPAQNDSAFSARIASQLLGRVREGVEGRSQKKMLAAFGLNRMENAPAFKQQIAGLFSRTETIRVHLNLVEATAGTDNQGKVLVDAEMEADPRDNSLPVHKRARLTLVAEKTAAGWKFTSIEPRSFFSLEW